MRTTDPDRPSLSAVRADVARKRWTPEARRAEAVRILVEQASELTHAQITEIFDALRDLGYRIRMTKP